MEPRYARYPFLGDARAAVEDADIDLADLVLAERSPVVDRAVERVEGAVAAGRVPDPIGDARVELLSYPVARVLVSLVDEPVLTDRYALAEARRAYDLLQEELDADETLRSASADRITRDELLADFGLEEAVAADGEHFELAVTAYLALSTDLYGDEWRLVTRGLADGRLPVTRRELDELLREAIRDRVADGLPLRVPDRIAAALGPEVDTIERSLADVRVPTDVDTVVPGLFPPCLSALIDRLRGGESLSDFEQFAAVSFLATIGLDEEEMVEFLEADSSAREQLVRYQTKHVHGDTRSTAYPPPSCATMQAAGACVDAPDRCDDDRHAVAAYARRLSEAGEVTDWRLGRGSEPA